jgi:uncharacterized protein YecE (DUF72 family)
MIRIGTAGWSYASGEGRWSGIFYPPGKSVDQLEFYAHFFDTVEVNSTFYRELDPAVAHGWAAKTPGNFRFAVKLFQKFTHPKMFEEAVGKAARIASDDFATFKRGVDPLLDAGKLGPVLAQFPPSFKASAESLEHLERLVRELEGYQLVVELRHRSWTEDLSAAELMRAHDVSWVRIDEPRFKSSVGQVPRTGHLGYFRFHGRNWKEWWGGDRETRYDYLYSPQEQAELVQQVTEVASVAADTHAVYNNHFRAKAVANALQMKLLLGQDVPGDVPEPLLDAYPDLRELMEREAVERR